AAGRGLQIGEADPAVDPRVAQIDGHPQRPEPVHALQLVPLDLLDLAGEVAERLQVLDVVPVLVRLGRLGVDDRDLPGLGDALVGALDDRLVDALLDDLVAGVVGAVAIEACWTSTRGVTSSGTGSFSLSRATRSATPHVTISCQRRRLFR